VAELESPARFAEAWLSDHEGASRRLPADLRPLFEREKVRSRKTADVASCLAVAVAAAVTYPILRARLPALQGICDLLFAGILAPIFVMSVFIVAGKPKPVWREIALGTPGLVAILVQTCLYVMAGRGGTPLFIAATLMLMLMTTVTMHLRFGVAVAWMVAAQALFAAGVAAQEAGPGLAILVMACGAQMLFVNRRMHAEQRRGFMFSVREQVRRDTLAEQNRALDKLARHDALTGLANRRAYDSWLETLWAQVAADGADVAGLIMLDVDHFKSYNDFYGHPAGDGCLASVAACLREQLRGTSDQVARIGGEEFAVVLPGVKLAQCSDIAERLRLAILAMDVPHAGQGTGQVLTISCGCASMELCGNAPRDLCAAADAALYQAKQSGRNRVCIAERPVRVSAEFIRT
jgi:diguanylate cyclase (GGDEF)-like protein